MFLGSRTPIKKEKYFINLGCSHAASYHLPIEDSYPYLLANKLDLGYLDFSYSRTSIEYAEYALNTVDYQKAEFILWQLTYPWRKHDFEANDIQSARITVEKELTLKESFNRFADVIVRYNKLKVYFLFINQSFVNRFLKELVSYNPRVFPENIEFLDYGFDEWHGGIETQKFISDKLFDFIKK
jgi:hypothetical protein